MPYHPMMMPVAAGPVMIAPVQPQMMINVPAPPPMMVQPIQQQVHQRKPTIRQVELTVQGNLMIDIPVPDKVLELGRIKHGEEFTHMR